MEITDCAKTILERINKFDPGNATRIIGYLLLYCDPEDLMQCALASDRQIYSIVSEVKAKLNASPSRNPNFSSVTPSDQHSQYMSLPPTIPRPFSLHSSFRVPTWQLPMSLDISHTYNDDVIGMVQKQHDLVDISHTYNDDVIGMVQKQHDLVNVEERLCALNLSNYNYSNDGLESSTSLRFPSSMPDYPIKPCQYFYNGFCRHGTSCRYSHGQNIPASFTPMYNVAPKDLLNNDHDFHPGSLEKLNVDISELLKSRNGMPVSIASLPIIYFAKYGKTLQADGYLTESQRHGKAGNSLTKLLARLQNIRLIDRPHGQHSVVLAEDAAKYMGNGNDRSDSGAVHASSNQIYLTFPAESTFADEDVMDYFMQFGPVHGVRIPRQEKRMFGFVSFHLPETVKTILGNPHTHIICGSRVLVKPYKEKTNVYDRKRLEKVELPNYHPPNCYVVDADINTVPRISENLRLLNKHLMTEREHVFENERMRLMEMHLASEHPIPQHSQHDSSIGMEDLKNYQDRLCSIPIPESNCSSDDKLKQESGDIELPDNPFAYTRE